MKRILLAVSLFALALGHSFAQTNTPQPGAILPGVPPQAACYTNYPGTPGTPILGPCTTANTQTTVNCSTSGTAVFAEVSQNPNNKKVLVQLNACLGTASYTYPTPFLVAPSIYASNTVAATVITTNTITTMTVTGATSTGSIYTEAY